jgi:hypothetical protein
LSNSLINDFTSQQPSQLNKYECGVNLPPGEMLLELASLFHTSVDYLLIGSQDTALPLHNHRLLDRFRSLQLFNRDDQETVIKLIDALIFKYRVQGALHAADADADADANADADADNESPAQHTHTAQAKSQALTSTASTANQRKPTSASAKNKVPSKSHRSAFKR